MRTSLFFTVIIFSTFSLKAQVTQINNNNSLQFDYPLSNTQQIFVSGTDQTIWVTDGSLAGTIQLSDVIQFENGLGSITFLNGKYIFSASTAATGIEVYITDGTPGGTVLVKDINTGAVNSNPEYLATLNGFLYFTAQTAALGEELWRTDGTPAGTTLVKDINPGAPGSSIAVDLAFLGDYLYFTAETAAEGREIWRTNGSTAVTTILKDIVPGTTGSNYPNNYELFSSGTYLLFMARTPSSGVELWTSNGTNAGTVLLKDINEGADSSNGRFFSLVNNVVLFAATDATHGDELWKTDGTPGGTTLLKDINDGTDSSTKILIELVPGFGFSYPVFTGFKIFKNRAFFIAYDGTSAGQVWRTDGTTANTILVKNIVQSTTYPLPLILITGALDLPNKFIFSVSDLDARSELWESNGEPNGTVLFKAFTPPSPEPPGIFYPFSFTGGTFGQPLFQGNKFFFRAGTAAAGIELWISDGVDGTDAHTHIVKDINPGIPGSDPGSPYLYTTTKLFFPATTAANGVELWQSDGTTAGTTMVQDINVGTDDADPVLDFFILNGKILFEATDGDNEAETDLFVVDGTFTPLPVTLLEFTVTPDGSDALLRWTTQREINSKDFTIQRSYDGIHFENIGVVEAASTTSNRRQYAFPDRGVSNSGKDVVYYRLIASDKDGKTVNTNIISLKFKNDGKWNVRLLSNPVVDNIKLLLTGSRGKVQIIIRDIIGKTVYTNSMQDVNGLITLSPNLQRGAYILITETNNDRKSVKFLKQ